MDCHFLNDNGLLRSVLLIHVCVLHCVKSGIHALNDLAEDRVLSIQVGRRLIADEELGSIGRRSFIRHAHDASSIVPQRRTEFILKVLAVDGIACLAFASGIRRATLDHEGSDVAVEVSAIVLAAGAESEEVVGGLGDGRAEDLELQRSVVRVQL